MDLQSRSGDATMEVRTLFFAAYRDLVGAAEIDFELPPGSTVADLVRSLRERGAPYDRLPADPAVAVNQAYALGDPVLSHGDEVAFIPPVAGG